MEQQTLFTKKVVKEVKKKVKEKVVEKEEFIGDVEVQDEELVVGEEIKPDRYGWEQLKKIDKKLGCSYLQLGLHTKSDLGGKKFYIWQNTSREMPQGMLGGMWGSGGETFNHNKLDEIQAFFDKVTQEKKDYLTTVYRKFTKAETEINYEHHNIYYYFRLIPAKNFVVIINEKLLEMIEKTGFDFEKWYAEYKNIPENPATDEHWEKAKEILNLMKQGKKVIDKTNQLMKLKEAKDVTDLSLYNLSEEERAKNLKELPLKLKDISDKIKENEQFNGCGRWSREFWWELQKYGILKKDQYD